MLGSVGVSKTKTCQFIPAETSRVMALRVQLMMRLRERLKEEGYTQVEAAQRLGVTQPRIWALLKGTWKDFSMDMLLTLATRAGLKPELRLSAWAVVTKVAM